MPFENLYFLTFPRTKSTLLLYKKSSRKGSSRFRNKNAGHLTRIFDYLKKPS